MSSIDKHQFTISQEDWSLHRKGHDDQTRHKEKVQEAIKKNLPDLITEESIILSNGKEVIKIPIRSLDEYKIRYNYDKNKHVGQGDGDSQVGDVIARDGGSEKAPGKGQGAGDQPGEDYYEAEVSFAELESALFKELELPNLQRKDEHELIIEDIEFNDIRKTGLMGNIDKKRTMMSAFKRNALTGTPSFYPIYPEDLKFKTWNEKIRHESKAVILAMMDTSGRLEVLEWNVTLFIPTRDYNQWTGVFSRRLFGQQENSWVEFSVQRAYVVDSLPQTFYNSGIYSIRL